MPPVVALLFCSAFVLFLLCVDRRQAPAAPGSLWIPTIWMMLCSSKPVDLWLAGRSADMAEGSGVDRNILLAFIGVGLVVLSTRRWNFRAVLRANRWLLLLFVYMAVSLIWSDYTFVSFKRYIRQWSMILMALMVATERDPASAFETIVRRTIYVLIPFSILLIKYYPDYGVEYARWTGERMWVGVTTQKNGLGRLCLISALFLVWTFIRRWKRKDPAVKHENITTVLVAAMVLWLFRGPGTAYSATSIISMCMGVGVMLYLLKSHIRGLPPRMPVFAAVAAACILYGVSVPYLGTIGTAAVTSSLGRDSSFTGRTDIWDEVMVFAKQHAFLGVGYGAFWVNKPIHIEVSEAHNGYLDVAVELGYVGVALLAAVFFSFLGLAKEVLRRDFYFGCFGTAFMLVLLLHNITETSFLRTSQMWYTFVFIQICFSTISVSEAYADAAAEAESSDAAGIGQPIVNEPVPRLRSRALAATGLSMAE
jgi:O-antigen ligase